MKEEQLLAYLKVNCAGRKNIRTRAQLQRALNLSKDQLTNMVHRMRCKGLPIAGGPLGYCAGCGRTRPGCAWIGHELPWAGDSAGGALAAACALRVRDEGRPWLCFQLLVYPVTDSRMETASMRKYTDSPMWNARLNQKMWELYLRDADHGMPQYAAPLLARNFSDLPPAYMEIEEFDCLHDEGIAYAKALEAAGVAVQVEDVKGTFHGFDFFADKEIAKIMAEKRIQALRDAFRR